jgi:peptide deformylase
MKFKIIPNEQTPKAEYDISEDFNHKIITRLFEKFVSFASRQKNCAGLASNQVSLNGARIHERFFAIKSEGRWDIVINPRIKQYRGKVEEKIEGCLTWLGKKIIAKRHTSISVEYFNIKGEKISADIAGYEAQIWQHEMNHLDGIEEKFID